MKLNKILSLAKAEKYVGIIDTPSVQWIQVREAAYPLAGFPRLTTREEALTMLGAAPKDFEDWNVSFFDSARDEALFSIEKCDADDENVISAEPFGLILSSTAYAVYATPSGVSLVRRAFFLPPDAVSSVVNCDKYVRLMDGMFCVGVVAKHLLTELEIEDIARLRSQCAKIVEQEAQEE